MSPVRVLLWVVLAVFAVLTGEVLWWFGYAGFVDWALHNLATTLLFIDLVIALTLLAAVMLRHAQARGLAAWPYIALAAAFGAAGPLLYFARHLDTPRREAGREP